MLKLPSISLPGLRPESLGHYLATLGLLRVAAQCWPQVRLAWRDETVHLVGGPANLDDLLQCLIQAAAGKCWTPYNRTWVASQKESTKKRTGRPLAEWQGQAAEEQLEIFAAHVVPRERAYYNPLLGSGGNAGKRAFSEGWKKAVDLLEKECGGTCGRARKELQALLTGEPLNWLVENLNGASWFSDANKLYNSGQNSYREGLLSPWAMVLACEGLPFFAGAASRRLGSRARAVGAFPFVTQASAPSTAGEAGVDKAEVWVPIWERPMSLPEVRSLFARGRAEVGGRGAVTPAAFATAIIERGVDSGVSFFLRFSLGRTTSENTFEPRFQGRVSLLQGGATNPARETISPFATALERVLGLLDRLPADRKEGKRWRFAGLRGPIERALIQLAGAPSDVERACGLLDAIVHSLDKVDRNQRHREAGVSWEPLPVQWVPALFGPEGPVAEARLALAVVSGFPAEYPFTLYRFGVEWQSGRYFHPRQAPLRWVWGSGKLAGVLADVLTRRLLDWEEEGEVQPGTRFGRSEIPADAALVHGWLEGQLDERALERWLSRLSLFDWRRIPDEVRGRLCFRGEGVAADGTLLLFGLFEPLVHCQPVFLPGSSVDLFPADSGVRTPASARRLAALIRAGQTDAAVRFAMSRYAMGKTWLVKTKARWLTEDPERLLASLLMPLSTRERGLLIQRWLRPQRDKGELAHV